MLVCVVVPVVHRRQVGRVRCLIPACQLAQVAEQIRRLVREQTSLTCSVRTCILPAL